MAFTVQDFQDLLTLLDQHPEWRQKLFQRLADERFRKLPDTVDALKQALIELAAAQKRTEQRVEELAAAQKRTEQRVEELAAAQKRTEQRVEELAAAQKRTEQRVEELAAAQKRTEQRVDKLAYEVGRLKAIFGSTVEDEAAGVAREVLLEKGYEPLKEAVSVAWNGEVDVVFSVRSPQGENLWVLIEAKARLSRDDVYRWAQRMRSASWHRKLSKQGVPGPYLVYVHGIRIDLGARKEAERQGIGLLYGQGELLAPAGLIYPEP